MGRLHPIHGVRPAGIPNNSVDGTKIAMGSDAQGDILFYGGTDYKRLAAGTSGRFLQTKGNAADPEWVSAGLIIQVRHTDVAEKTNTTTTPAKDTSVPLITEGVQIVTDNITLRDANSRVKINLACFITHTTADQSVFAIFRGNTCIGAAVFGVSAANQFRSVTMEIVDSPASASELTYSIRWGVTQSTGHLNKATGGSLFGGAVNIANGMTLEEIAG